MRYSEIGGLKSSKFILGTDYYGQTVTKNEAFRLIDTYIASGGNHIDTARIYGGGATEPLLGEWLSMHGHGGLIVATKGGHPNPETMDIPRLSEKEIEFDLDGSLKRLRVDYIDLYWLHRDGRGTDAGEIIESLNRMVRKGKIREFGCSNWSSGRVKAANDYAKAHGLAGFAASQIKFSPAVTSPTFKDDPTLVEMNEDEFNFYSEQKIPVMAFAPQGKGFFSKMAAGGENALSEKAKARYLCGENLKRLKAIQTLSEKYGCSIAGTVCAILATLDCPDVFPIIGGKNVNQLSESLDGANVIIDKSDIKKVLGYKTL